MATPLAKPKLAWLPQHYSYGVVLAAAGLGLLAPAWVGWVLGPVLLLGLVGLGVAHGACDQFVVPATHPALARHRGRYWLVFLGAYLGLAGAVGALWWWQPGWAVAFFFGLSAWHWGSGDAPAAARYRTQWLMHSLLRGALIFAVPLLCWPVETRILIDNLLALAGAAPVSAAALALAGQLLGLVVLVGHLLLWRSYLAHQQASLARTDLMEVLLLGTLLVVLPPVLSGSVYFVFWHSLQHVLRMNRLMGRAPAGNWAELGQEVCFFLKRSAPLLAVSVAALGGLYSWQWARAAEAPVFISLALLVASVVTLPHALLVTLGMDAGRWRRKPAAAVRQPGKKPYLPANAIGPRSHSQVAA